MFEKNIGKYLVNYAEPEAAQLECFPNEQQFHHVLVVPAFKEEGAFAQHFAQSSLAQENCLMIVVINQPDSETDEAPQIELFTRLKSLGSVVWQNERLSLVSLSNCNSSILIVNRFDTKIPEKQGVGLARKIGADIALALQAKNQVLSSWICSTDADVSLPSNYFSALAAQKKSLVAACYNFTHQSEDKTIASATAQYETALRYYLAGLRYAKSPYAYFTIGSTIAIKAGAYATVRGFPKRSAGEDFYLLNKTAKLGEVGYLQDSVIEIQARLSDRVPFGTGPAVSQIIALNEQGKPYCYYHPEIFESLKHCIVALNTLYTARDNYAKWQSKLPNVIRLVLSDIGLDTFFNKHQTLDEKQFTKQLTVWFDAFKTLKFIHGIRDRQYPNMPLAQAIASAAFQIDD